MRTRVAQAGWSTATTRVWPSMRTGRVCGQLGTDQFLPPGENALHRRRRRGGAEPVEKPGHRVTQTAGSVAPPDGHAASRLSTGITRATAIPSGRGAAVVRMD